MNRISDLFAFNVWGEVLAALSAGHFINTRINQLIWLIPCFLQQFFTFFIQCNFFRRIKALLRIGKRSGVYFSEWRPLEATACMLNLQLTCFSQFNSGLASMMALSFSRSVICTSNGHFEWCLLTTSILHTSAVIKQP